MSKPEDIPQDVWDEAMRVAVEMEIHAAIGSRTDAKAALIAIAMVEVAARAILAAKAEEREACAQVAQAEGNKCRGRMDPTRPDRIHVDSAWGMCADTSGIIRDAIRKRGGE